jgi:acetylornithine deacetylase/succinyl-diaminopimelate desuccinylase family protein
MLTKPMSSLEIAQALVRIPSVNPNYDPASRGEQDVAAWIESWGREQGFEMRIQPVLDGRSNVILRVRNGADHPHLLFNGHTDTVAVTGMSVRPFGGDISEQRLWGRGAADMKGPLACMLAAGARLRKQTSTWKGCLTLACVVDEEYRYRGISALMEEQEQWDVAVVGEPTVFRVVRGCKGCMRFAIRAHGKPFHSSRPERGRNAIVAMARAILELTGLFNERLSKVRHPDFGPSTCSIGLIEGGSGINIVPENCTIQVDVRLIPGMDAMQTFNEIESTLRSRLADLKDIDWFFEPPSVIDPGYEISADTPLVRQACAVVGESQPEVVFYSCDASKIAERGIPCIVLGPGDIAEAHTADESIGLADLEAGTEVYVRLAQELMPVANQ